MTKAELKKALDLFFEDDEVVVCADENDGWDNITHLGRVGRTAAIYFGGGSPFSDEPPEEQLTSPGALAEAIEITGSSAALARALGVSPQCVSNWKTRGIVTPKQAKNIEKLTGVSRERLNSEIFGK